MSIKQFQFHRRAPFAPRAFSLIELLVAIAVVGILLSILVSVMRGTKQSALKIASASNLRQCGSLLSMVAAQNNNQLEFKVSGDGAGEKIWAATVADLIASEVGGSEKITSSKQRIPSLDILYSPLFYPYRHDPAETEWRWSTYGLFALATGDYATNENISDNGQSYGIYRIDLSGVTRPSMHPLLMDSVQVSLNPPSQRMAIRSFAARPGAGSVHMRNDNKALAVFLDGSVRDLGKEELRSLGFQGAYDKDLNVVTF